MIWKYPGIKRATKSFGEVPRLEGVAPRKGLLRPFSGTGICVSQPISGRTMIPMSLDSFV